MRTLTAQDILQVWERGRPQHPLDRALTILAQGCPELRRDDLLRLSIGQRDAALLTLREATFGPSLTGFAECSSCGERLEFTTDIGSFRGDADSPPQEITPLELADVTVHFRLPDSRDLAAVMGTWDSATLATALAKRCVIEVWRDGQAVSPDVLTDEAFNRLTQRLAECDPQAEILLNMQCPACGHAWEAVFDIVAFFWSELTSSARRLLQEVDVLARIYGWCERDILEMSPWRRQCYLEMVGS